MRIGGNEFLRFYLIPLQYYSHVCLGRICQKTDNTSKKVWQLLKNLHYSQNLMNPLHRQTALGRYDTLIIINVSPETTYTPDVVWDDVILAIKSQFLWLVIKIIAQAGLTISIHFQRYTQREKWMFMSNLAIKDYRLFGKEYQRVSQEPHVFSFKKKGELGWKADIKRQKLE